MEPEDITMAQHLAEEGIKFSEELRDDNRWFFETLENSYFSIALAISLTWTKHAQHEIEFITYAANYIDGRINKDSRMVQEYCLRFGEEGLDSALWNYRKYYREVSHLMPDFRTCDAHRLTRLQQRLLSILDQLRTSGRVEGIGPWLFNGPFKIILSDQDRLWNDTSINTIVLPTGIEVDKGIRHLKNRGYSFLRDFELHWLEQDTRSLLDLYGTHAMVHNFIEQIGNITNTPALHINSALYLYGKDDI